MHGRPSIPTVIELPNKVCVALSVAETTVAADSVGDWLRVKDGECLDLHGGLVGKGGLAPLAVSD